MAQRLIWAPRALDDLAEIVAYIEKDSPAYARAVARRCFDRAEALVDQPGQGRRLPEYSGPHEVREVFVHRWRLIYAVTDAQIRVLAIIHGARLIEKSDPLEP